MRIRLFFALCLVLVCSMPASAQQRPASNVLYSYKPLPLYLGLEIGTGVTFWQNASPTFFPTRYPYSDTPDTLHTWFPSGSAPLFGFFIGASADIDISTHWGFLAKLNYNERRGSWHSVANTECDMDGKVANVPITNDLTWMLRCVSAEGYARYRIKALRDMYVGGGLAITVIESDHYDLNQRIEGPAECSFRDFGTGQPTGIKAYGIGGTMRAQRRDLFGEFKLLAGYPLRVGYRWTLSPEVTIGVPLNSVFDSRAESAYRAEGIPAGPSPLTVSGLVSLKYQIR